MPTYRSVCHEMIAERENAGELHILRQRFLDDFKERFESVGGKLGNGWMSKVGTCLDKTLGMATYEIHIIRPGWRQDPEVDAQKLPAPSSRVLDAQAKNIQDTHAWLDEGIRQGRLYTFSPEPPEICDTSNRFDAPKTPDPQHAYPSPEASPAKAVRFKIEEQDVPSRAKQPLFFPEEDSDVNMTEENTEAHASVSGRAGPSHSGAFAGAIDDLARQTALREAIRQRDDEKRAHLQTQESLNNALARARVEQAEYDQLSLELQRLHAHHAQALDEARRNAGRVSQHFGMSVQDLDLLIARALEIQTRAQSFLADGGVDVTENIVRAATETINAAGSTCLEVQRFKNKVGVQTTGGGPLQRIPTQGQPMLMRQQPGFVGLEHIPNGFPPRPALVQSHMCSGPQYHPGASNRSYAPLPCPPPSGLPPQFASAQPQIASGSQYQPGASHPSHLPPPYPTPNRVSQGQVIAGSTRSFSGAGPAPFEAADPKAYNREVSEFQVQPHAVVFPSSVSYAQSSHSAQIKVECFH